VLPVLLLVRVVQVQVAVAVNSPMTTPRTIATSTSGARSLSSHDNPRTSAAATKNPFQLLAHSQALGTSHRIDPTYYCYSRRHRVVAVPPRSPPCRYVRSSLVTRRYLYLTS
jgi:hypothetical protein